MAILTLYKDSKIIPSKNFVVDNISTYLGTLTQMTINDFQYVKNAMTVVIKIDSVQLSLDYLQDNYNYCSILNETGGKTVYYFAVNKKWISSETIQLSLVLDSCNTFVLGTDYTLSPKTKIMREHKDRFIKNLSTRYMKKIPFSSPIILSEIEQNIEYYLGNLTGSSLEEATFTGSFKVNLWDDLLQQKIGTWNCARVKFDYASYNVYLLEGDSSTVIASFNLYDTTQAQYGTITITFLTAFTVDNSTYASEWVEGAFLGEIEIGNTDTTRLIDFQSEGLSPVLYKKEETMLYQETGGGGSELDWFLIYKNQNEPSESLVNPVDCFLCANTTLNVDVPSAGLDIDETYITNFHYYYIPSIYNRGVIINITWGVGTLYVINFLEGYNFIKIIKESGGLFSAYYCVAGSEFTIFQNQSAFDITSSSSPIYMNGQDNVLTQSIVPPFEYSIPRGIAYYASTFSRHTINSLPMIDRTDSKLIKIIKLPYAPTSIEQNGANVKIANGWTFDGGTSMLKLNNLNTIFQNSVYCNYYFKNQLSHVDVSTLLRNDNNESKLYHSDYYQPQFVYDSFKFTFQYEKLNVNYLKNQQLFFQFNVTSTINSRFMFTFTNYEISGYSESDYDKILPISRNNEIVLYNVPYISYLKTGYNYDVKNKARSEAVSWILTGVSAVGAITSAVSSAYTGAFGVMGAITLGTSAVTSLTNAVNTTASAEANQSAKEKQLKNQSATAAGSDDVDLMSIYSNNKAKMVEYSVSALLRKCLLDLFYYTGYISGEMKIPVVNTRYWFNFCQAEIVYETTENLTQEIMDDIKERFAIGISFMHNHSTTYDFAQVNENYETWLKA